MSRTEQEKPLKARRRRTAPGDPGRRGEHDLLEEIGNAWTLYKSIVLFVSMLLFFAGVLAWGYVITESQNSCGTLLIVELIVQLIVLAGSVLRVGLFSYEDHIAFHIKITFAVDTILSLAGYYIAQIQVLDAGKALRATGFYYIIDFFVRLLVALLLAFVPSLAIALLMWGLVKLFGRPLSDR